MTRLPEDSCQDPDQGSQRQIWLSGMPYEIECGQCRAAEKVFGVDKNGKGFKVPRGCGVIQGDGVTYEGLVKILDAVLDAGFSAEVLHIICGLRCFEFHSLVLLGQPGSCKP